MKLPQSFRTCILLFTLALNFLFATQTVHAEEAPSLIQFSTIDALLSGLYEGMFPLKELTLQPGNTLGIGTFDKLDGEMIVLDGEIYQIKADGQVYKPTLNQTTPFASVVNFSPEIKLFLTNPYTFERTKTLIQYLISNPNIFVAIKITGFFRVMTTRSVPAQEKPYRQLAEVTKNQPKFEFKNIKGTIVGFYLPTFIKGINVPGLHLHFLSEDKTVGGHILNFTLNSGSIELQKINNFHMVLPKNNEEFKKIDLSQDRTKDLYKVESKE